MLVLLQWWVWIFSSRGSLKLHDSLHPETECGLFLEPFWQQLMICLLESCHWTQQLYTSSFKAVVSCWETWVYHTLTERAAQLRPHPSSIFMQRQVTFSLRTFSAFSAILTFTVRTKTTVRKKGRQQRKMKPQKVADHTLFY